MKSLTALIEESGLSHAEIARRAGVSRTTVSRIVHGKQQMRKDTALRLASALGLPPEAVTNARTTQPAEPEVIKSTPAKIREWGAGDTGDRQLSALVMRLIRAEIPATGEVQGPTGRETVRPGPDIKVKSPRRTRHIPQGKSVWEVSTRKDVAQKATEDLKGALKRFKDDTAAKQTHFIFVTTQIWTGAANWRATKAKEKKWASISVYDATDLQAWLEEFTTVQLWFKDQAGISSNNDVEWLKTQVDIWCKAANPRITTGMVKHSVDHARRAWQSWRQGMHQGPIAVRGGSIGEAMLLIQALIEDEQAGDEETGTVPVDDLEGVVVHSKGALSRLVEGRSDNLVIVPAPGLEEDAVGMADRARIALPTTRRTHSSQAVEVKREPRSNIDKCLQDLGLDPGNAARLARASSGSPNALRQISFRQRDLSRRDLPKSLQRVAAVAGLVGTWEGHHPADIEAVRRLTKLDTPDAVDDAWQDLALRDEPMTWTQGPLRGVNSRLDAWLRATKSYADRRIIEDYIQLTQLELTKVETTSESEIPTDDAMDADRQEENRVSTTMLDGLCKGLILLREYADEFDHLLTGSSCAGLVEQTVHAALSGTTVEHLRAISSVLPSLAEACPECFLDILAEDAEAPNSVQKALLKGNYETATSDRTHTRPDSFWLTLQQRTSLMDAYECLGWFREHAPLAVDVLMNLADEPIPDHHGKNPVDSLSNMLKAWTKGCCLTTEEHMDALTKLVRDHPDWGVEFVTYMLPTGQYTASPTTLPWWRGKPDGAGSQTSEDHHVRVVRHAAELICKHPTESMATVSTTLQAIPCLPPEMAAEIWRKIMIWIGSEQRDIQDNTWLRRRLHMIADGADPRYKRPEDRDAAKKAAQCLQVPGNTVPNIWIFDQDAVIRERRDDKSWEHAQRRVDTMRQTAIVELVERNGLNAIWQLLPQVPEQSIVGTSCARCLSTEQIGNLVDTYLADDPGRSPAPTEGFMVGLMFEEDRGSIEGHIERQKGKECSPAREHWKADLLAKCRIVETSELVDRLALGEKKAFWNAFRPNQGAVPKDLHEWLARGLASVQRPRAVLQALHGNLEQLDTATLVRLTRLLLEATEPDYQFWDEKLVDETLNRADLPLAEAARIEFQFFGLLQHKGLPALTKAIARDPRWFQEALMLCMHRKDLKPDEDDYWKKRQKETSEAACRQVYRLFEWLPELPGFDDTGRFRLDAAVGWTRSLLDFAAKHDRLEVAQILLGRAFAAAGMNDDQEPTAELVELLEALHNPRIEESVATAAGNQVGPTRLPADDPGRPARERSERYYELERRYYNQHPRTARVMRLLKERCRTSAQVFAGIVHGGNLEGHDF